MASGGAAVVGPAAVAGPAPVPGSRLALQGVRNQEEDAQPPDTTLEPAGTCNYCK